MGPFYCSHLSEWDSKTIVISSQLVDNFLPEKPETIFPLKIRGCFLPRAVIEYLPMLGRFAYFPCLNAFNSFSGTKYRSPRALVQAT